MQQLFNPDRFQENPELRTTQCPISLGAPMQTPFRIPDFQQQLLSGKNKRDRIKALAEFAIANGICSDSPEVWHLIQRDFIEPANEVK
jgi:hypothetical protein